MGARATKTFGNRSPVVLFNVDLVGIGIMQIDRKDKTMMTTTMTTTRKRQTSNWTFLTESYGSHNQRPIEFVKRSNGAPGIRERFVLFSERTNCHESIRGERFPRRCRQFRLALLRLWLPLQLLMQLLCYRPRPGPVWRSISIFHSFTRAISIVAGVCFVSALSQCIHRRLTSYGT